MVTTSKQVGEWIEQEHATAVKLLGYASSGGSYSARSEQAMRAALVFKRCEAFGEIRARLLAEEQQAARVASMTEAEGTPAGRRNSANGIEAAAAAAVVILQGQAAAAAAGVCAAGGSAL